MSKNLNFIAVIFVYLLSVTGCSSDKTNPLVGRWNVVTYTDPSKATLGAIAVSHDEVYTLHFHDTGFFSFSTDCNTISGDYTVDGKELRFIDICATELACDKEIVERSIKCQLPMVHTYDLPDDTTLCLLGQRGNVLIKLVKAPDREQNIAGEADGPLMFPTDAGRTVKYLLAITSDSLLTCSNNFSGKDEKPLIIDTTNPELTTFIAQWINSMDSVQINELLNSSTLHITVGTDVSDGTVGKVKRAIKDCGVDKFSVSNFDI